MLPPAGSFNKAWVSIADTTVPMWLISDNYNIKAAAPFMRSRYHRVTLLACGRIHFWPFVAPLMRTR